MSCDTYYDLALLKKAHTPIDHLVQYVASRNQYKLHRLKVPSRIWKFLYDVTPELVHAFNKEAYEHVKLVQQSSNYGYLYFVATNNDEWFNAANFEYENYPLMVNRPQVLDAVRQIASRLSKPDTNEFNVTCVYLLYFFGLLVNPDLNWIMMDYLNNGNKHHQYGTRLKGELINVSQKVCSK